MPAKDLDHDTVRNALIWDGWTITRDPYTLAYGSSLLAAEKGDRKIAVEVLTGVGGPDLRSLCQTLGRYAIKSSLLGRVAPDRELHLAVTEDAYGSTFSDPLARPALDDLGVRFLVIWPAEGRISRWGPSTTGSPCD